MGGGGVGARKGQRAGGEREKGHGGEGGAGEGRKGPENVEENGKGYRGEGGRRMGWGHLCAESQGKRLLGPLFLWLGLPVSLVLRLRHLSLLGDAIKHPAKSDHELKDRRRRGLAASCSSYRNTMQKQ